MVYLDRWAVCSEQLVWQEWLVSSGLWESSESLVLLELQVDLSERLAFLASGSFQVQSRNCNWLS